MDFFLLHPKDTKESQYNSRSESRSVAIPNAKVVPAEKHLTHWRTSYKPTGILLPVLYHLREGMFPGLHCNWTTVEDQSSSLWVWIKLCWERVATAILRSGRGSAWWGGNRALNTANPGPHTTKTKERDTNQPTKWNLGTLSGTRNNQDWLIWQVFHSNEGVRKWSSTK